MQFKLFQRIKVLYTDDRYHTSWWGRILRVEAPILGLAAVLFLVGLGLSIANFVLMSAALVWIRIVLWVLSGLLVLLALIAPFLPTYPRMIASPTEIHCVKDPAGRIRGIRNGVGRHWLRPFWVLELVGRVSFHKAPVQMDHCWVNTTGDEPIPVPLKIAANVSWMYDPRVASKDNLYDLIGSDAAFMGARFADPVKQRLQQTVGMMPLHEAVSWDGIAKMYAVIKEAVEEVFGPMGVRVMVESTSLELQTPPQITDAYVQQLASGPVSKAELQTSVETVNEARRLGLTPPALGQIKVVTGAGNKFFLRGHQVTPLDSRDIEEYYVPPVPAQDVKVIESKTDDKRDGKEPPLYPEP